MKRYQQEAVEVKIRPAEGEYLKVRTQSCGDQPAVITVGRGADWSPLACKDVYGRAVKEAVQQGLAAAYLTCPRLPNWACRVSAPHWRAS